MGAKVVFKPYDPDQLTLLPYKLDELVPQGHPVRIVKQVVDAIVSSRSTVSIKAAEHQVFIRG